MMMLVLLLPALAMLAGANAACDNANVFSGKPCCPGTAANAQCTASVYGYAGYCKAVSATSHICTLCDQKNGICCPGSVYGSTCYASNGYCYSANVAAKGPALTCKQCNSPNPPTPCCPNTQVGQLCHGSFGGPAGYPTCGGGACGICTAPAKGAISPTNPAMCMPCGGKGQPKGPVCAPLYGQCGGKLWTGPTCCQSGAKCVPQTDKTGKVNIYYSQCLAM